MLDRLEASGYISRNHDSSNRRIVRIKLSAAARNFKSQYNEVSTHMNEIFYNGFSNDEIINFEEKLIQIQNNLLKIENKTERNEKS